MVIHESCPGYPAEPFASLVASYPGQDAYAPGDFRVEWGPVFHRGRLDGSARVLLLGQDPAAHEAIARRILVGEAGQRAQGLLHKIGIASGYVMVNVYLYSVYGQAAGNRHVADEGITEYRNRWLDALLIDSGVTAVVAFGQLAERAFGLWAAARPEAAARLHLAAVKHPTYAEGAARGSGLPLAVTTARQLADWNAHLDGLRGAVVPDGDLDATPYGQTWSQTDLVEIPERDLPAGVPAWWRSLESWAVRAGADPEEKRATIRVAVPKGARPWPQP